MSSNRLKLVVSMLMVASLVPACGGSKGGDGSDGSGGSGAGGGSGGSGAGTPTCDETTKGFVSCNMFITCQPGTYCSDPGAGECSDGCASNANCGCGETCQGGSCVLNDVCGDGKCTGSETSASCSADCKPSNCGNMVCDPGETFADCPFDCPMTTMCGNGVCEAGETAQSCPGDCNTCGNGTCDASETPQNCPADCVSQLEECNGNCDAYNFFQCFQPGQLQECYDACAAASDAQLKQFNVCAATGAVSCEPSCFDYLP